MTPRPLWEAVWFCKCSPTEKLILDCIAFHASPGGGNAWPSVRRLSRLTGLAKSTVETHIATLIKRGYLSIKRHGNQQSSNHYQINIATLMENGIPEDGKRGSVPPLRYTAIVYQGGGGGVPATGTGGVPATGTQDEGGVPMGEWGVSRSAHEGVPATGTEQKPTLTTTEQRGMELWQKAKAFLIDRYPGHNHLWRGVTAAELDGMTLRLHLPIRELADIAASRSYAIYEALDAVATEGLRAEALSLRAPIGSEPKQAESRRMRL